MFIGVNSNDSRKDARGLPEGGARPVQALHRPEARDRGRRSTRSRPSRARRSTTRTGKLEFVHQGPYHDRAAAGGGHRPLRALTLEVREACTERRGGAPRSTCASGCSAASRACRSRPTRTAATPRPPTSSPSRTARVDRHLPAALPRPGRAARAAGGGAATAAATASPPRSSREADRVARGRRRRLDRAARADLRASRSTRRPATASTGPTFVEEGIEHVAMEKRLA